MSSSQAVLSIATIFLAAGLYFLLPSDSPRGRAFGLVLALVGFGCFGSQIPLVGDWFAKSLFCVMAGVTLVGAVATVTFRSPVYCAIWFGMTLGGVAGLFLLAGAEFLAAATIVVYAGAILVTFLFVLMLSEPEGFTAYDRRSWEAVIAAPTGAVMVGVLTMTIAASMTMASKSPMPGSPESGAVSAAAASAAGVEKQAVALPNEAPPTIAAIGAQLFTRYLIAVEAVGALLFAALVGAAVIVANGRSGRGRVDIQKGVGHAS